MDNKDVTQAAGRSTPACSHMGGEWEWRPRGFARPPVPAYAVYCSLCDTLLFTLAYNADRNEHRVGVPNFHTIKWQEYILGAVQKRFPGDRVVIADKENMSEIETQTGQAAAGSDGSASDPKFNRSCKLEIHAVGPTVEAALQHMQRGLSWGEIEHIEYQKHDGAPCTWYVRFTAGGTSMKAAGEYVRGGVIVTWWK